MIKNIFIALISACMLCSCIGADVSESKVNLSSDVNELTVQAEFVSEGDNIRTVVIRSNRSWFAHLDDLNYPIDPTDPDARVNWATLSIERHQNLTNTVDETEIVITFNENFSPDAVNGVLNIWCEGQVMKAIPIVQSGRAYHVSARTDVESAKCDSDVVSVSIESNTKWTARVLETSTAEVSLEATSGNGSGTLNIIFGENFSPTETKIAYVVFSAKNCEDYVLAIPQNRAVSYVYVLPECDGRVLSGETKASLKIRSNVAWTAEVVESELEDFTIVNPTGQMGISEPQLVEVTFKANNSDNPFIIKTAKIKFQADGMDDSVVYEFKQRGCFVVSFNDNASFDPQIANKLTSASGQPSNLSRPGRVNTDVDAFKYSSKVQYPNGEEIVMELKMSQYIRYDSSSSSLYVMGSGKIPHITFSGIEGLTIGKMTMACIKEGWFSGNIVSEDHVLASKTTPEYTEYITQETWDAPADGGLHYVNFDLSEKGLAIKEGQGCTLRTSDKSSNDATSQKTKMYVKSITFKYL